MGRNYWRDQSADFGKKYSQGKSVDDLAAAIKTLTGKDYDVGHGRSVGVGGLGNDRQYGSMQREYNNLFEPVKSAGGGFGNFSKSTGEMQLKADPADKSLFMAKANPESNADKAARLKEQLTHSAFDSNVVHNLYDTRDVTADELAKQTDLTGYGGTKDWDKWVNRTNKLTGESDFQIIRDRPDENNFYRKYKKQIIQGGAGILGFLVGGPAGALSAASLAGTLRDAYAARVDRRKIKDAKRDWEAAQKQVEDQRLADLEAKKGTIYRGAGEGVVEYKTADKSKQLSKKDTYVR